MFAYAATFTLGLLALTRPASAFTAKVHNNCQTSLYAFTSVSNSASGSAEGGKHSPELHIAPGDWYEIPFVPPVYPSSAAKRGGMTVLVSTSPSQANNGPNEAIEFSLIQDINTGVTELWYNWSKDHGDPLIGFSRTMTVAGCQTLHCDAGDESCDYSIVGYGICKDSSYIEATIC